ncbi:tetratricopeptide repeat protein [Streptomyces sp. NPDC004111]|uniref:tetratricopeptide repeat protein n=1 Tax=Streptomyces sp. NPDC004111 TaxID=3364690 RepID=UPI0036B57070
MAMTPEEARAELRHQVERARNAAGLSKKVLAERTGQGRVKISRTTVQQFFRPDGPLPSADTVMALAAVLRIDGQALLDLRDLAAARKDGSGPSSDRASYDNGRARQATAEARLIGPIPPAARSFQLRAEKEKLHRLLAGGGTAVLYGRPAAGGVLVGLGGVGKSQLAADYARTALVAGTVDLVVWVTAANRPAIVDRLAQAARDLCAPDLDDPEQAAQAFLSWLTPKRSAAVPVRWLVVLDDLTRPEDLHGLWPPDSPHGRTLVTTRRQDAALAGPGRSRLEVGLFSPQQSVAYLTETLTAYSYPQSDDPGELLSLAADMGHLPLALSQAAAYLADTGTTITAYRQALADRATALSELAPDLLPDQQPHTVAAAWDLSIEHADTLRPAGLARPLLHLASFLDPNGIPESVLTSEPARAHLAQCRTPQAAPEPVRVAPSETAPVSAADTARAVSALRRLSLITHTPDEPVTAVRVHQLLQHAVRDTLSPDQHARTARTAADALFAAWPDFERDERLGQALRANSSVLASCARDALHRPAVHLVVFRSIASLGTEGQPTAARDQCRQLVDRATAELGGTHTSTLDARCSLAHWTGRAGDAAGAAAAYADLASIPSLSARFTHDVLTGWARWAGEAGDADKAVALFSSVLLVLEESLGPEHPRTLAVRLDLARWRGEAGDAAGAAAAYAELVEPMDRVLGHAHPDTVTVRLGLVRMLAEAGDGPAAFAAQADLKRHVPHVLADQDPRIPPVAYLDFPRLQAEKGQVGAIKFTDSVIMSYMDSEVGEDHPQTLAYRAGSASFLGERGDAAGAAAAFADLVRRAARAMGDDHPFAQQARESLAFWQKEAEELDGAFGLYVDVPADMAQALNEARLRPRFVGPGRRWLFRASRNGGRSGAGN